LEPTALQTSGKLPSEALSVQGIHKIFASIEVLRGVSIAARDHDVVSIIGASGSGKSTFLRCINLLEKPTAGTIRLRGEELVLRPHKLGGLRASDPKQLSRMRARIAMVFQNFNLWPHMTVLENIIEAPMSVLGKPKAEAVAEAESILARVGMYDRRNYYPTHISGGQQQRAAIARALAMNPDVMLFDEPTSALDPELVGEVLKVMTDLAAEGRTMLVVTHEIAFARDVSSRVVFLHQGELIEEGAPDAVLESPRSPQLQKFLARSRR
jgi:ABC-type histidine transport system ATPase subunit